MKRKFLSFGIACSLALACSAPSVFSGEISAEDEASVIFSSNFEDEVINDWTPFGGGGKLSLDTANGHESGKSLKITERNEAYHGPSLMGDTFFKPEKTYSFSSWVYQESDSPKDITWTLRYVDSLGTANFRQIGTASVPSGEWTEIAGTIDIPEDSVAYLMYFECKNAGVDFNIDDIQILGDKTDHEERTTDKQGYLYYFDFENSNEFWSPRGDNRLIRTDEFSNTGSHSIYVANRTRTWNGPTVNVNDIKRGISYFYSAYIMYNGEEYEDSHDFRMEVQYNLNGEAVYQLITQKTVKKDNWTRITGTYTLPEGAADVSFYVQTANLQEGDELTNDDLMSFYTDTVTISETSVIHRQTAVKVAVYFIIALIVLLVIRFAAVTAIRKLNSKKEVLRSRAKDAMTQCFNRNAYESRIQELSKDPQKCKTLFFALCDVNFLKYINDNLGHEKGDEAITRCGQLLMNAVGNNGDVYRTGGDEFVCITTKPVKDIIREAIRKESETDKGYPFEVASGFAEYDREKDTDTPDVTAIIERSDKEMYADKQEIKSRNAEFSRK